MSQAAREISSRFAHLLKPIRDLTENWAVDVASQLEQYMEEIEEITISFDGGTTLMNFAEAALLIQGSTCVYSKKVEYLYTLVYQTLDILASKRKLAQVSSVDDQGKDKDVSFAQKNNADEFLTLDMVESTDIDMDERKTRGFKTAGTIPRTPMSLVPLQDTERASGTPLLSCAGEVLGSRLDFKMNTSVVHSSGALLLEPPNQVVFSVKTLNSKEPIPITFNTPEEKITEMLSAAATPLPYQREDGDLAGGDLVGGNFGGGDLAGDDMGDYSDGEGPDMEGEGPEDHRSSFTDITNINVQQKRRPTRVRVQEAQKPRDPWTQLLDPHSKGPAADCKPFKRGITYKIPSSLLKDNKGRKRKDSPTRESLADFINRSIYSCSSMFPKNSLKAPLSSEFEAFYWKEQKRRLLQKRQRTNKLIHNRKENVVELEWELMEGEEDNVEDYHHLGDDGCSDGEEAEQYVDSCVGTGFDAALDNYEATSRDPHDNFITMATNVGLGATFQGVEPMALDEASGGSAEPKELNYEDLVKNYVEGTMEGAQAYIEQTELSKRVQQWEDKIRPILADEEQYPVFDIHDYGARLVDAVQSHNQAQDCSGTVYFRDLMGNRQYYEVARMFAATLQLANDRNVEIGSEGVGEEAVDTMSLTLLKTQLSHKAISQYKAPSLQ